MLKEYIFTRYGQTNHFIFFNRRARLMQALWVNNKYCHCPKAMNIGIIHSPSNVQLPHM